MKIAYMIAVYKNFEQIKSLISCLNKEQQYCFVHVDKKNTKLYEQLLDAYSESSRVTILEERVVVNWSGVSSVYATLQLMKNVYASGIKFERIQLLSGEDFPVKPTYFMASFFKENRDKEFIEFANIGKYRWRVMQYNFFTEYINNRSFWIRTVQWAFRNIQMVFPERKHFKDLEMYRGSAWFNISIEAMTYILEFVDKNPTFLKQFAYTAISDEHFFQILLLNSSYKSNIINNNLYHIGWSDGKNSPDYIDVANIEKAKKDKNILFVRKIDEATAVNLYHDYGKDTNDY